MKYQRLNDRFYELLKLDNKMECLMEQDCICHLFECEGIQTYEKIALFCKDNGISRVIDIGCAYGHQSEIFSQEGLQYVGIDDDNHNFWNNDKFEFIIGNYPCAIPTKENDLGVSVLCLTWNCYLYEDDTLTKQCEALQRDFEHCLLYIAEDKVEFISKYFKNVKEIGCNLYYFSNI